MAKKKKKDSISAKELEDHLKAVEDQSLLYAKDLAKIFVERKEKERQLELTKQQLARSAKISLLGELAAGIAHEINNILTPAVGNISLLLMKKNDLPENFVNRLEIVEQSVANASTMLQQLLDLSRKKPEKREPKDIGTIIENSLSLLKYKFIESNIEVEKNLEFGLPNVHAYVDASQIGQVFTNLSLNAIDAMDQGGTLYIAANYHLEKSAKKQPYVEVLFEDTGSGISPDVMEHVFEPFYTTKDIRRCTGLGLFISYGIIEKHGGTIDVTSAPDKGTQFTICLPLSLS